MKCPYCGLKYGYYYWVREKVGANFGESSAQSLDVVISARVLYCQACNHRLTEKQAGIKEPRK